MTPNKVVAALIVSLFCVSGFLVIAQDDGQAAGEDYVMHIELFNEKDEKQSQWANYYDAEMDRGRECFVKAVENTVGDKGEVRAIDNVIDSIKYNDVMYAVDMKEGIEYDFIPYAFTNGKWTQIVNDKDYKDNLWVSLIYSKIYTKDQYNELTPEEQANYQEVDYDGGTMYAHKVTEDQPPALVKAFEWGLIAFVFIILAVIVLVAFAVHKRKVEL